MANQVVTPSWVMKQIGVRLVNNMRFGNNVDRSYSDEFKVEGAKIGYTVNARLPQRYRVNKGQAMSPQPTSDQIVPITLTDQANIGIEFSTASLTMEVDNYREKYIEPAVDALINQVDFDGLSRMYKKTSNTVGTPGVTPGSTGTLPGAANIVYMQAVVKLANQAVPTNNLIAMLDPNMHAYLASANMGLFNPTKEIAALYKTGQFGSQALGISKWFMDQNVATHTVGALGGTPLVNGANQSGSSIVTDAWTAAVATRLKEGDVVQFSGCYTINPLSYQSTGQLKDWSVAADTASDGSGNLTIPLVEPMVTSGPNQNCSNAPADNAPVTIFGHASSYAGKITPQALVYTPGAYALVFADLEKPGGLWVSESISNKALGVAIRFLKDYDIMSDQSPARLDLLYGWAAPRPEFGCRVCSGAAV